MGQYILARSPEHILYPRSKRAAASPAAATAAAAPPRMKGSGNVSLFYEEFFSFS